MTAIALAHRLDRTLVIQARRETVFQFFTDTPQWAAWWGAGSTIDPRPGGRMLIRHPNGVEVAGQVLEVQPPERIVFTYGYAGGKPIPADGSRVTIRLDRHPKGTLLQLTHEFADVTTARRARAGLAFPVVSVCQSDRRHRKQRRDVARRSVVRHVERGRRRCARANARINSGTRPPVRRQIQLHRGRGRTQRSSCRRAALHARAASRAARRDPSLSVARAGRLGGGG